MTHREKQGLGVAVLIVATIMAIVFVASVAPYDQRACPWQPSTIASCLLTARETLSAGLIAGGGALFAAWQLRQLRYCILNLCIASTPEWRGARSGIRSRLKWHEIPLCRRPRNALARRRRRLKSSDCESRRHTLIKSSAALGGSTRRPNGTMSTTLKGWRRRGAFRIFPSRYLAHLRGRWVICSTSSHSLHRGSRKPRTIQSCGM
jgi:hypothetical protein